MMAKYFLMFLMMFAGMAVSAQDKQEVFIESQSRYGLQATVDSISKFAVADGWKVTIVHDLQETMKKNGKEVLPVKVMEICNPGLAYQVLSRDSQREVSVMLPCRISVYEKSDGVTYISRMNSPAFASMIGGDAANTIVQAFRIAETFIDKVKK